MKLTTWIFLPFVLPLVSCLPGPKNGGNDDDGSDESSTPVNQTTCNGRSYSYDELAGYGVIPSDFRDKTGDTIGGPSASFFDQSSWKKTGDDSYEGLVWTLPDRGWNTQGTLNYQIRIHKFALSLTLQPEASASNPAEPNLIYTYLDTILLTGPDGKPTTGLRPDTSGPYLTYPGFPILPSATYEGNGFGQEGQGDTRISIDSEGLVVAKDHSFWVSDEYGPYIYHFSPQGRMIQAIQPPNAFLPRRNDSISFASDDPPIYDPDDEVVPEDVESGRANNQGLEGLTISENGQRLYALTQSALSQDGGTGNPERKQARLLEYRLRGDRAVYQAEYVVTLPVFDAGEDGERVAAQSEILAVAKDQFFVLARDSNKGAGQDDPLSLYRRVDVFDISRATNIKSPENDDSPTGSIADEDGNLEEGIRPAEYCTFLDINVNSELAKFGLQNGGAQDDTLLNEKWEALSLVPVEPNGKSGKKGGKGKNGKEYFLFVFSDNDFITQNGFVNFGQLPYSDESGFSLNIQSLVFRVTLDD